MTGKNIIGFSLSSNSEKTFQTLNPFSGLLNPTNFFEATFEEADEAVKLADVAFKQLKQFDCKQRALFLTEIAKELLLLEDELIKMYCSESGLSEARAISERTRTINQIHSFATEIINGDWINASIDEGDLSLIPPKADLRKMMLALGPVVVFGASNFPLAYSTAGGDTISALAAGCPVIVKSHPMHAGTGELVAQAIVRAAKNTDMPDGIFSNLNSSNFLIGQHLVKHSGVHAVGFTGSLKGGRALFDLANQREKPIPVFAEMGSLNPIVILPEALLENSTLISQQIAQSITNDAGQFCTKPGVIILVNSEVSQYFIDQLESEVVNQLSVSMLHPAIFSRYVQSKDEIESCNIIKIEEAKVQLGSNIGQQAIVSVDANQFLSQRVLQEEVFGPLSVCVLCSDIDELKNVVNSLNGQLTMSIFATNTELTEHNDLINKARETAGRVIFNGVPTGVTVCPSSNHGGPYPATTDSRFTAVGIDAMQRFLRPVSFQNCPLEILPIELQNINVLNINRRINGEWTRKDVHKNP